MTGRRLRRMLGIVVAVGALSALYYLAFRDVVPDGDGPSFAEAVAVVSLLALTLWALYAVRANIQRQDAPAIERLPPQPGDVTAQAELSAATSDQRRGLISKELASYAPAELRSLHDRIRGSVLSRKAYEQSLEPLLRELATSRAQRGGRRVDVDALVDIDRYLPVRGSFPELLMRVPIYRRIVIMRAVHEVIKRIEEM